MNTFKLVRLLTDITVLVSGNTLTVVTDTHMAVPRDSFAGLPCWFV